MGQIKHRMQQENLTMAKENKTQPRSKFSWCSRKIILAGMIALCMLAFGSTAIGDSALLSSASGDGDKTKETISNNQVGPILENLSLPPGLTTLTGIIDDQMDRPLKVRFSNGKKPLAGETITFKILVAPPKATGDSLSVRSAVTDSDGVASTTFNIGSKSGLYVVCAFVDDQLKVEPLRFRIDARSGGWVMFLVFGLLGGLGIFLMGMELSGDGLKDAAGDRMRGILSALTSKRVLGLIIGVVATTILQSSSATTVMLVGFVSATMMNLSQAIGVMIGAKIGTTVTAQLIAFNLSEYSLMLVAFGFLLRVISKKKGFKQAGNIILGFGLIFFGLGVMGSAMRPLRTVPEFSELLVSLGEKPILGILLAVGFTSIVQSSAATIGLAIALCAGGLLSLDAALPLAWGAHIGTCATALLSSLGTGREGKQVAISHLLFSVVGVAIAFPFIDYFVDAARYVTALMGSSSVARELANGHMIFTVITGVLLLPFVKQLEWLTKKIVPPLKTDPPFGPKYLVETSLDIPVLALEQAHLEILRMAKVVRGMLVNSMTLLKEPKEDLVQGIIKDDDKVDILEKAVRQFLARVAQRGLDPELSAREHGFIYIVQDFEGVGDILYKEIAMVGRKLADRDLCFSEQGREEIASYHEKILAKFDRVTSALKNLDRGPAEETIQLGFKERMMERKLREAHLERLHSGAQDTLDTSSMHLSVLNNLRAIGEKLDDIARTILEEM